MLREGGKHNVPNGLVQHSDVVGLEAGSAVLTTKGDKTYYASRLTLEEYICMSEMRGFASKGGLVGVAAWIRAHAALCARCSWCSTVLAVGVCAGRVRLSLQITANVHM